MEEEEMVRGSIDAIAFILHWLTYKWKQELSLGERLHLICKMIGGYLQLLHLFIYPILSRSDLRVRSLLHHISISRHGTSLVLVYCFSSRFSCRHKTDIYQKSATNPRNFPVNVNCAEDCHLKTVGDFEVVPPSHSHTTVVCCSSV